MPSLTLKVAAIHYRAVAADKSRNIRSLSRLIEEAAANGAGLMVLPELCTTGLSIGNSAEARILAEPVPGPSTAFFSRLATRCKAYLVLGLAEYDPTTDKRYNAQVIIGPDGDIVGRYRKVHLFGPDFNWATEGKPGYQAVDVEWGRIGLGICFDINHREFLDFMSAAQIDILAFSTNWVGDDLPFSYWSDMVADGGYYLIAANNWGREGDLNFSGGSVILSPEQSVLSQTELSANGILYADIGVLRR